MIAWLSLDWLSKALGRSQDKIVMVTYLIGGGFGRRLIEFLPSTETPVGLGEPATTAVAPAIGNAIFAASGARVRHLPIRPEAVRQALAGQT